VTNTRKKHGAEFKVKVAMAAEISSKYGFHESQVNAWKKTVLDGVKGLFGAENKAAGADAADSAQVSALHEKVGQLIMERDFFRVRSGR
jgi:transposase